MNILAVLLIGAIGFVFYFSANFKFEPFSNHFTTTMHPAIYNEHEYGHPESPYSYKPIGMGPYYSFFHHYKPFHYGYGGRAYGSFRGYPSFSL